MPLIEAIERITEGERRARMGYVAADAVIFHGALVAWVGGFLVPADDAAYYTYAGVALQDVDNTGGSDGDLTCQIEYNQIVFVPEPTADATWIGIPVYTTDDNTVAKTASYINAMGLCVGIDPDGSKTGQIGVWIDTSRKE